MNLRDLLLRVRALLSRRRVEGELDEELAFHIAREAQKHIAGGLRPEEARTRARARFGSAALAAGQCRDARGTAGLDTFVRDVTYALRALRRAPLASLTIVATVALGLGIVTIVFTFYSVFFLRVDAVRHPHELVSVERLTDRDKDSWYPTSIAQYDAIRRESGVFADAAATMGARRARVDGRIVTGVLVSGNFFEMLGVRAVHGRVLTPGDDDAAAGRPVIVLSDRGWERLFARDPAVVGRPVRINGRAYDVIGVMPAEFRGLAIRPPEYWAPLALARELTGAAAGADPTATVVDVVGRLKPGVSQEAAQAGLGVWTAGRPDMQPPGGAPVFIRLRPRQGTAMADTLEAVVVSLPLFFAFGLILLIGCANVANLLLARGVTRHREIGVRMSLGASRGRIVRQLLTESLLLALAAAAAGLAVSRLFLEGTVYAVNVTMPPELSEVINVGVPEMDWRVFVFLGAGAVVSTALFGLAPALQTTRIDLVRAVRGVAAGDGRPRRVRHRLIALQVGASALLLICAAIFLRGAMVATTADVGVRTADTIIVPVNDERRMAVLRELGAHPLVATVSAASPATLAVATTSASVRAPVDLRGASPEYFDVLGIEAVRGRAFAQGERTPDAAVAVVSETAAGRLWPGADPLGQIVRLERRRDSADAAPPPAQAFSVVGVVRDAGSALSMAEAFNFRGVYVPTDATQPGTALTVRVHGDPEQARRSLIERLDAVDPALREINTLRTLTRMAAYLLQLAFSVAVALGGLALLLTVSGLFSVLSYVVAQRTKDIGVHMAVGASSRDVALFVIADTVRPVVTGLAIGTGLAAAVAIILMATPAAGDIGTIVRVLDPVAYAAGVAVIATASLLAASVPMLRAARMDPLVTLRQD